jgi:hypothetical protein
MLPGFSHRDELLREELRREGIADPVRSRPDIPLHFHGDSDNDKNKSSSSDDDHDFGA